MEWKTRVTELFGCRYPILEGAYGGFGHWQFARAISETGALGMITAGACRTPEKLREDIQRYRDATDKPFAVNLSIGPCPRIDEMLDVCIEQRVSIVETAAYKPDALAPRIKAAGLKWIHKSARVKDAFHAEQLGADAVIVVGLEGTGFKSPEQLPTLITTIWATRQLKIPFIAAGGIGDARGFLGALGMGAEGIMMGTAFMATKECPIGEHAKERLVQADPGDPRFRHRVLSSPDPADYVEVMKLRGTMPEMEWVRKIESVRPRPYPGEKEDETSSINQGSLAVATIEHIPTVKELIDSIVHGAEKLLDNWQFLKTR
ncbi:MAG: nitronate monooxygenase [Chloroflexi bacterium]|nr:nitronate monooxygenase [Chloroflexota bacterium]